MSRRLPASIAFVSAIVPKSQDRVLTTVIVTDRAQGGSAQEEVPARTGIQPQPTRDEDAEKMAAGKEQHISINSAEPFHHATCPISQIDQVLAAGATVAEYLPAGPLLLDLVRRLSLVIAVVPFGEVAINDSDPPESRQFAGAHRSLQWAGEDTRNAQAFEPLGKSVSIPFTSLGQWEISQSGVLPRDRPGSLAVSREIDYRKLLTVAAHDWCRCLRNWSKGSR